MTKNHIHKLTLYQPATYQIKVPGRLDTFWVHGDSFLSITVEESADGQPISILTGKMDQAALQGLLQGLYGMGLPVISVVWVEEG